MFSASSAEEYFEKTYSDNDRNYTYQPIPGMLHELQKSAMRKRNAATPGSNALPYLLHKKCAVILKFILRLGHKIWKKREIPTDWACAYIV